VSVDRNLHVIAHSEVGELPLEIPTGLQTIRRNFWKNSQGDFVRAQAETTVVDDRARSDAS
jgi:hypothetical protein